MTSLSPPSQFTQPSRADALLAHTIIDRFPPFNAERCRLVLFDDGSCVPLDIVRVGQGLWVLRLTQSPQRSMVVDYFENEDSDWQEWLHKLTFPDEMKDGTILAFLKYLHLNKFQSLDKFPLLKRPHSSASSSSPSTSSSSSDSSSCSPSSSECPVRMLDVRNIRQKYITQLQFNPWEVPAEEDPESEPEVDDPIEDPDEDHDNDPSKVKDDEFSLSSSPPNTPRSPLIRKRNSPESSGHGASSSLDDAKRQKTIF